MSTKKTPTLKKGRTLLDTNLVSETQFNLVQKMIKHFKGRKIVSRKELREAHGVLMGKKASPYFISKNIAAKVEANKVKGIRTGSYNLGIFKIDKNKPNRTAEVKAPKKSTTKALPAKKRTQTKKGAPAKEPVAA